MQLGSAASHPPTRHMWEESGFMFFVVLIQYWHLFSFWAFFSLNSHFLCDFGVVILAILPFFGSHWHCSFFRWPTRYLASYTAPVNHGMKWLYCHLQGHCRVTKCRPAAAEPPGWVTGVTAPQHGPAQGSRPWVCVEGSWRFFFFFLAVPISAECLSLSLQGVSSRALPVRTPWHDLHCSVPCVLQNQSKPVHGRSLLWFSFSPD